MEPIGWFTDLETDRWEVTHVGAEPVVLWDHDLCEGLPSVHIFLSGWCFEDGTRTLSFSRGAEVGFVLRRDPPIPIEEGFVTIGGYTINELRELAHA